MSILQRWILQLCDTFSVDTTISNKWKKQKRSRKWEGWEWLPCKTAFPQPTFPPAFEGKQQNPWLLLQRVMKIMSMMKLDKGYHAVLTRKHWWLFINYVKLKSKSQRFFALNGEPFQPFCSVWVLLIYRCIEQRNSDDACHDAPWQ